MALSAGASKGAVITLAAGKAIVIGASAGKEAALDEFKKQVLDELKVLLIKTVQNLNASLAGTATRFEAIAALSDAIGKTNAALRGARDAAEKFWNDNFGALVRGDPAAGEAYRQLKANERLLAGGKAQVIDVGRLKQGGLSAVPDSPVGHVSIRPGLELTPEVQQAIRAWAATRPGALADPSAPMHRYTRAVWEAIINEVKRPPQ